VRSGHLAAREIFMSRKAASSAASSAAMKKLFITCNRPSHDVRGGSPNWLEFTISISRNDKLEIASFEIGHASPREEAPSVNSTAVSKQFTVPLRVSAGFFPCLALSRWGCRENGGAT